MWNIRTNAIEWSDEIYRIFGREPSLFEPTYPNFLQCVHPQDRQKVEHAVARALENGTPYSIVHRVIRPDGSEVIVHERAELQYESGIPVRMIGTVQDVTERELAHQGLAKFSSAIEQSGDQVMITDREGRIESGHSRDSIIGQTPRILKSGLHPLEFYKNVWTTLLAGHVYRGVFINRRHDGAVMYEEKTIAPVRDAAGEITHFISTGRDISDRRRAEREQEELRRALEVSVTEWRLTFDAIEFPILVCDREGLMQRANAAAQKLSSLAFADLIGSPLYELPRCQPWTGIAELLPRAVEGESVSAQVREPVERRTWDLVAMPFTRDSEVSRIIFIARDVTALLDLQESLRRTEVMSTLGALVAGVAHEVRNPLFAISATIDAFEGRALDQERFDQFTTRLRGELSRLSELMQDLLQYGRPADVELQCDTLREPIELALRSTETLAGELHVTIDADLEGSDVEVLRDTHRLQIALRNLLDNAVRHAGAGGRVSIRIARKGDEVEIAIHDSGSGFAEADIPLLFEPFFTRRRGGTGLGLSIVHRTIEQHGGSIVAENHPAGGALMRIRLPIARPRT
jgi:PAS domain S-box-containing protein